MICFSGDGRPDHIYDGQRSDAFLLCLTQGCQRICRLAGLADDNDQVILVQQKRTIAEFTAQLDTDRYVGQVFNHILGCHSHVIS